MTIEKSLKVGGALKALRATTDDIVDVWKQVDQQLMMWFTMMAMVGVTGTLTAALMLVGQRTVKAGIARAPKLGGHHRTHNRALRGHKPV